MIKIQATFIGYGGVPCSLFSMLDTDTSVLAISVQADYRAARRDDCLVITNDTGIERDRLFGDDDIKEAIKSFYMLKAGVANDGASPRLTFSERAARANPESSIEKDGIDVSGPRFRVSESVTCGQMAALATCLYATKSDAIERSVEMADEIATFMNGGIITI
ncbi:hypothetical protein SAMN05216302_101117 [Nitrosomonas aestuarii]|uniref:Uncharacterized protein n=1 Tax=Nitrosomonas aestuarii TaxID=52441 RepID=A0A1I4B4G2_9PROT|nr:hypothetical protein [Nitrosomonas aestuarii]SFK63433.1 hypothetical protein SAMN05216302_101117 [Nitrosomonas aestuarii]